MKRWVDFDIGMSVPMRGFEGSPLPIDKLAELVLGSTAYPIAAITLDYVNETGPLTWKVVATSETHVGSPGNVTVI